jgi:uncharacterized protein YukE
MMLKTIWQKLKNFIIVKPKLGRFLFVGLVVLAIIIPVQAWAQVSLFGIDIPSFADILSHLFLWIASWLGQLLVVIIDLLLGVVQYNDFIDSEAVKTGWSVVRDICNMFFVLILLVIAFGTILRLQNYRMNRLLGKLIIMIVLVNFSKMIAGFFIDISQVVSMTFVNAFADTAAGNFTQAFHLREMLSLGLSGTNITSPTAGDWEIVGVTFLAAILLIIASMTMLSILVVFVVRIVMLWVLVVLSPLAYMLSVIPLGAKYGSQWWSNFGKWVTMGPVLVFFIWLSLTILGSGAQGQGIMGGTDGSITNAGGITAGVAAGISEISTSENLLSFILAVAMLMIALSMAGSLGGVAGGFAGKISGKIQAAGVGTLRAAGKVAGAPLKGGWELTKTGGRKARRMYRDSAFGKYTNIAALLKGARQRGEVVETLSKDRAAAAGRELWDKRPGGVIGGGADVIPATQLIEMRYERAQASEVATLQKEQKAGLLKKIWNKGGYQADITRRAILQSLAAEGHPDDALATDFFRHEAEWTDRKGVKRAGYAQDLNGNSMTAEESKTLSPEEKKEKFRLFSSAAVSSDLFRSAVSKGGKRSAQAKDIKEGGARALYDLEDLGKKVDHYEYAGESGTNKKTGKLEVKSLDEKFKTILAEISKPTSRKFAGMHRHNFSELMMDKDGKTQMVIVARRHVEDVKDDAGNTIHKKGEVIDSPEYSNFMRLSTYAKENESDFVRFSASRNIDFLGKLDTEKKKFKVHDDDTFERSLRTLYEGHPELVRALETKAGSTGYIGRDGSEYSSLDDYAIERGWAKPKVRQEQENTAKREKAYNRKKVEDKANEKEEKAGTRQKQAAKIKKEINKAESGKTEEEKNSSEWQEERAAKLKKANELDAGAEKLRKEVHLDKANAGADGFEDHSAEEGSVRVIKNAISKEDIEKYNKSLKNAFSEVDKAFEGLGLQEFTDVFDKSVKNLSDIFNKLPDDIKKNLSDQVDGLQQAAQGDQFKTQEDQYQALGVLKAVQRTLEKRQRGSHDIEGVSPGLKKEKKTKEEEIDFD